MKRNTLIISTVSIISIFLLTGCMIIDRVYQFVGPNSATCEEQVISYTREHPGEINIFRVNADVYDTLWQRIKADTLVYYPDGDYYAGEWAKVQRVKGEEGDTVLVYFEKNETEYMREINVSMQHPSDGEIRVTQLPAGVEELPER